jgi:alkylation response protein AidB-like acyl-CoA dehydrogenase
MISFAKTEEQCRRLELIGNLSDSFIQGAHAADEANGFSYDHVEALREIGYTAYTVPRDLGGQGISLYEFVLYQERLAQGDASIALGMGWHLGVMFDLAHKRPWKEATFARLCEDVVKRGALINRAASEAATGSPSRGGKPQTTAISHKGGYRIDGRKTFTTMSPVLDYFIVTATVRETGAHAEFLVPRGTEGLKIVPTWNMAGMRGTASHDLVLDGVVVPADALVYTISEKDLQTPSPYLLHIPACYLGIALAARREALKFAAEYQPNSLDKPILYTPNVGQLLGTIDLELLAARHFLYAVAARWDEGESDPNVLIPDLAAVKYFAVQTALSVVDKALRITGSHGLSLQHPLQRLYRDVRFGLHNPPMDDLTIRLLGQRSIREAEHLSQCNKE